MADVFISYAREDRARAEEVANGLSALGLDSFWDTDIPPGQTWADYIEGKLAQCKIVVVLWTEHSTKSQWVREEARMGRDKSKLIPVRLDNSPAPFGFGEVQAADLSAWRGESNHPEWVRFASAVRNAVGAPSAPQAASPQGPPEPQVQSGWRADPPASASAQPQPAYTAPNAPAAAAGVEQLSPVGYVQKCLRLYVNGQGRARRAEFWWWALFTFVVGLVAAIIDYGVGGVNPYTGQANSQVVTAVANLALLCPNISVMSRRFHDVGLSGWLVAAFFGAFFVGGLLMAEAPSAGALIFLAALIGVIVVAVMPSKPGPNQYGPNPKGL